MKISFAMRLLPLVLLFAAGYYFAVSGLTVAFLLLAAWVLVEMHWAGYRTAQLHEAHMRAFNMTRVCLVALKILGYQSPQIWRAFADAEDIVGKDLEHRLSWDELMDEIEKKVEAS